MWGGDFIEGDNGRGNDNCVRIEFIAMNVDVLLRHVRICVIEVGDVEGEDNG